MTCTLTVHFLVPGYQDGTDVQSYSVPDGSYQSPYAVPRTDLGNNGSTNNAYDVRCDGDAGTLVLATYFPGSLHPSISSATNSCEAPTYSYDCINGACTKKNVYNTPGIYSSLSECETACGTGCSGKCVSNSDWAQIEGLASQLRSKECG
ncbi:hypothetical protein [Nostoc sp. NMS8]|uniref:hypothetical protein n=1 Tax=Nostoc sp. NMS8 TaxID=2815392 RepID=UPI0025F9DCC7|nr:hypothetical protein [Nostoc sp. NMS8]MBN3957503.1 hypothetical protein [Nostoc sp. NMS8]